MADDMICIIEMRLMHPERSEWRRKDGIEKRVWKKDDNRMISDTRK